MWRTALDLLSAQNAQKSSTTIRIWETGAGVREVSNTSNVLEGLGRIGLVTNQSVCTSSFETCAEVVRRVCTSSRDCEFVCILGPQHGYYQTEQDNMIETPDLEFRFSDGERVPLFSLYSETREPTSEHMQHFDTFVVDLVDVGCRIYTYMLTLAGCLRAAAKSKKKVVILDRPNPLGLSHKQDDAHWSRVEGNLLDPIQLHSFVGYYSIPMRHGLTLGELARLFIDEDKLDVDVRVVCVENTYKRKSSFNPTWFRERWVLPSPNLPSWDSCFFFPSTVILEGTNLSEGRGSTCPFQLIGAPYLDAQRFVSYVHQRQQSDLGSRSHNSLLGVVVREHRFRPTFNKHKDTECKGVFFHALEHENINLFALGQHLLYSTMLNHSAHFQYKSPPYEYNHTDLPLLLIMGNKKWKLFYDNLLKEERATVLPTSEFDAQLEELLLWSQEESFRFSEQCQHLHLYTS